MISYLPQFNFIPHQLTVKKAVALFLNIEGQKVFFSDPDISKIAFSKISQLSGGELRYVQLKLILSSDSKFIILDEPFLGLSPLALESAIKMILEARKTKGIIITDHNYSNVLEIATKKYILKDGILTEFSSKEDLENQGYVPRN